MPTMDRVSTIGEEKETRVLIHIRALILNHVLSLHSIAGGVIVTSLRGMVNVVERVEVGSRLVEEMEGETDVLDTIQALGLALHHLVGVLDPHMYSRQATVWWVREAQNEVALILYDIRGILLKDICSGDWKACRTPFCPFTLITPDTSFATSRILIRQGQFVADCVKPGGVGGWAIGPPERPQGRWKGGTGGIEGEDDPSVP
ncbi:hypothetical protein BDM02DRAFT_3244934 [Thelephora ganbajun]|uniref:Uncharacterized protein n=1 Tax=Thelephora ganbajun TaxID=370292 RepID=A0ACB6YYI5_THEGA|nr:hypothetical protein BDM02DRAFT_3244934 [Thelephora ganbajun]